eukprot:scaffold1782_cov414-Prasinococcus_capsulatus_cf.AAC.13
MTHCGLTYSASLQEPRDVNLGSLWQSVVQSSQGSESCKAGTLDWTDYVTEQIPLGFEFNVRPRGDPGNYALMRS